MLSVKTGQYHPSLENSLIETIKSFKKDDPLTPLLVVSPTNWMWSRLQERVSQETTACINIHFMKNFYALANEICRWSGIDIGRVVKQSFVYECIVQELLKQQTTINTALFKNMLSMPTHSKYLFNVMQDLMDANICATDLKAVIKEGLIDGEELQKLYNIAHLYDIFIQRLNAMNISYDSDVYRFAAASAKDSKFLKSFTHILAYGFYDLTGIEQDFWGEIFRFFPTTLFLPYQKKHNAFTYVKNFFESFVLRFANSIEELPEDNSQGFSCLMISELKEHADNINPSLEKLINQKKSIIKTINVSGKKDELWTVAKEILKLADEGCKMEEIGVVARTLEPYTEAINKIFKEHHIPFITSVQEPIEKYPLVKAIQQLLLLKRENYYRPVVIDLLRSPYFKIPAAGHKGTIPRPDQWDLLSRKLYIRGDINCWLSRLKQAKSKLSEFNKPDNKINSGYSEVADEANGYIRIPAIQIEFLENILGKLSNDLSSIPEKASWSVMSERVEQLIRNYISLPSEGINSDEQNRVQLILDKIFGLLHFLHTIDCLSEEVTQDQFIDTFIDACRHEALPLGYENCKGVKVLDAMSARGIQFRALFILGLNEKVFPRAISEEPFLRDHTRRKLCEVLGNYIPEKLKGYEEERLLFYFLLNAARERLYLLYERSDEAGKPRIPSHYLMDILQNIKAANKKNASLTDKSAFEIYVSRSIKEKLHNKEIPLLTLREIGIRLALEHIEFVPFLKTFGKDTHLFNRLKTTSDNVEDYKTCLTAHDGIVGDMSEWWNEKIHQSFSPTNMETFGLCPFKYFLEKVLELEIFEEPETIELIPAIDLGTLYHNILSDLYNSLIEKRYFNETKTKEINPLELLQDITKKHFERIESELPIPYPVLWEVKKDEVLTFLKRFVQWDIEQIKQMGYIPSYIEQTVKLGLHDNIIKYFSESLEFPGCQKIKFGGKIDRIDLKISKDKVDFRVIDYKSGKFSNDNPLKSAIRGKKLQLPFYIIMAEHFLREELKKGRLTDKDINLEKASLVYLTHDELEEKSIKGKDWEEIKGQCLETLREFLQYIRDGIFPVSLDEDTQKCSWCEFITVCRRSNHPLQFRLGKDTRLKRFREICNLSVKKKNSN